MPDRLFGLPAHPLLVHLPVVMLPLCAILAIVLAVRPKLVRHYGPVLVGLTGVAFVGTFLAAQSGEGLQENILKEHSAAIERHAEWGDRTRIAALVFFVCALAFVMVVRKAGASQRSLGAAAKRSAAVPVLAALMVLSAVGTTAAVIYTGHTGAKSAWEDAGKEGS